MMNKKLILYIDALDCASCASTIDKALNTLEIDDYTISIPTKELVVFYQDSKTEAKQIQKMLKKFGYKGEIIDEIAN